MRSVTNYFLVNLAVADMGMAMFNCIPSFIFMLDRWTYSDMRDIPTKSNDGFYFLVLDNGISDRSIAELTRSLLF